MSRDTDAVKEKSWEEFRQAGLLWMINTTLHIFGWAICIELDENGKAISAFPARVRFRGFTEELNSKGYVLLSEYMNQNSQELVKESKE